MQNPQMEPGLPSKFLLSFPPGRWVGDIRELGPIDQVNPVAFAQGDGSSCLRPQHFRGGTHDRSNGSKGSADRPG